MIFVEIELYPLFWIENRVLRISIDLRSVKQNTNMQNPGTDQTWTTDHVDLYPVFSTLSVIFAWFFSDSRGYRSIDLYPYLSQFS